MGMESFGNVPTKESIQAALDDSKRQLEKYSDKLQQAKDTPVSNLFSEGAKHEAIQSFQTSMEYAREAVEKYEKELAELN